jgi:glycosyltransferase involved in cell wall biosynthesis
MRICYFGTYRANYVRNRLMIERLRGQGAEVVECHATLWRGLEDRQAVASGGWLSLDFWRRAATAYGQLLKRYRQIGDYDVLMVGYPGQPDLPLAWLLTRLRGKPLVWDVLMSIFLIAEERGLRGKSSLSLWLIRQLEQLACRLPDLLLIDTAEYAAWFHETYGVTDERVRLLPLGADDRVFRPLSSPGVARRNSSSEESEGFLCLYYGTFIPNHGVRVIIEAARRLRDYSDIRFELVGQGPEREKMVALAENYGLTNVTFVDWLEVEALVQRAASAEVLLGTFGITPQALLTMHNKIHEGLAMAKPVINGDSPVMRSTLQHGEHIFLCERENPQALAEAILTLRDDAVLRERLARQGYAYYREHFAFETIGRRLVEYLESVV